MVTLVMMMALIGWHGESIGMVTLVMMMNRMT